MAEEKKKDPPGWMKPIFEKLGFERVNQTDSNDAQRQMLNTQDSQNIGILYRAPIDPKHKTLLQICGICFPFSCLFCKAQQFFESTYAQVHENRVEFNMPGMSIDGMAANCSACRGKDNIHVIYFDTRKSTYAVRILPCLPLFTHWHFCPSCCDICGDGVVLYGNKGIICWVFGFLLCQPNCCRSWDLMWGLVNGNEMIKAIYEAKQRRNKKSPAPVPKEMINPKDCNHDTKKGWI